MNAKLTSTRVILFFSLILSVGGQDDYLEKVMAELEIANLELQDDCENVANALKLSLTTNTFSERIKVLEAHGELLKAVSENLRPLEDDVPPEFFRNWTLLVKPGDPLLPEHDWSTLVTFDITNEEVMHTEKVHCNNETQKCIFIKNGYEDLLESSKNETLLRKSWSAWQTLISLKKNDFPKILNLVKQAASQNGKESPRSYWEMLADKEEGYNLAEGLWDQIKPLYFKLHSFVQKRLFRYYNMISNDTEIPVYLLGSNFGDDWSHIANIILPHPQLHHLAESYLDKTTIQNVYKLAEEMTRNMSLGTFGPKFWSNSVFNMTFCENHLISYCVDEHSELLTCDKTSWVSYLDAFEVAIDVTLRNMDYLTLARSDLRYSVLDEALKGLGSTLAVKNMRYKGVWDYNLFLGDGSTQPNEMTELLLVALRILPKLPFYLAADKWRLHLLENGFEKMEEKWWDLRKEYQGVVGVSNVETDFLGDRYITSNRPYLSKFLGTILQFQFLDYYKPHSFYSNQTIMENMAVDDNFLTMLREKSANDWSYVTDNYYSFYGLSATAMLDYFAPLETYFDSAPQDQVIVTTTPKPSTTTTKRQKKVQSKSISKDEIPEDRKKLFEEVSEPPLPPIHEHVEENLEGPNSAMENISMYIGLALLGAVASIIIFVIVSKRIAKKRRSNNRRYET